VTIRGRSDNDLRVRLELTSAADSVTLVRSVIRTVARATDLDRTLVDDLCAAVSEACNNVVLHAYLTSPGPLIFSLAIRADTVEAVVRDRGAGIRPGYVRNRGLGLGVGLINALADRAEFESSAAAGTEVRMMFRRSVRVPETLSRLSVGVWAFEVQRLSGALRGRSG
jgi:anti-sigma regulatory factor (Ser/Thr protein kinase)